MGSSLSLLKLIWGALTSDVFWGLNLACFLILIGPIGYLYLVLLAPPILKPILVFGILIAAGIAQAVREYYTGS